MSRRRSDSPAPPLRDLLQKRYPTRNVACPQCRRVVETPRRAITLRCPHCTAPLQLQDAVVSRPLVGTVRTLGNVKVTKRGSVRGTVDCAALLVEGAAEGDITVRGSVLLSSRGALRGKVVARSLVAPKGARVSATLTIGEAPARTNETQLNPVDRLRRRANTARSA